MKKILYIDMDNVLVEFPSAWSDILIWVKTYLSLYAHKRLILSHHKNLNYGDFLVDDRLKNGADQFQGKHIHFGTSKFPNWMALIEYLMRNVGGRVDD